MKKLFLILFLIAAVSLQAQHKAFQFGFKGGASLGWFKSDNDTYENDGVQFGGSWGFVADIFLMENYSFTTGFNVLYLNGSISNEAIYEDEDGKPIDGTAYTKYKPKYLQLPVIFTMKTNNINDKLRIYGQIGYGLAFLLSSKQDFKFISNEGDVIAEATTDTDDFTSTRSSLILGVGVEVPLHKSTYLRTGFTFDNCFVDVAKQDFIKIKSNFIELSAAVIF